MWPVCLNALFSILKHKVTVGKDTQKLKRAVCCSEVGPIDETAQCKQGHHPNFNLSPLKLCPEQIVICWSDWNLDLICVCRPTPNSRSLLTLLGDQANVDVIQIHAVRGSKN